MARIGRGQPNRPQIVRAPAPAIALPITDTFTGSNGTKLDANAGYVGDSSHTWDLDPGSGLEIQSNRVSPTSAGTRAWANVPGAADIDLAMDINFGNDGVSRAWTFRFRRKDLNNFLYVKFRRSATPVNQIEIWERVGGSNTRLYQRTLSAGAFAANTVYRIRVTAEGSIIKTYIDGVLQPADDVAPDPATTTRFQTETGFGFAHDESIATGQWADNLNVGAFSALLPGYWGIKAA